MNKGNKGFAFPMELPPREERYDAPILDEQADPELMDLSKRHHSGVHIDRITSVTLQDPQTTGMGSRSTL